MKRLLLLTGLALVSLTGLSYVHPFGNPRVEQATGPGALLQGAHIPQDAKAVLVTKCADCHSSATRWPVYSRVAPGSWLMEHDIIEARKHMDLSHWEQQSEDEQQVLLAKISHEARNGDMPPLQYLALHWDARLTLAEAHALSNLAKTSAGIETTSAAGPGDAVHGKALFDKRCTGCHSMEINGEGPRLAGVFGRKAGSVPGYDYSTGLKNSGITWDGASLEKWLSGPDQVVPDAKMDFYVPKAAERLDLIAFLQKSSSMVGTGARQ